MEGPLSDAVAEYDKLVKTLTRTAGVEAGQMFGKPCLKVKGKAFVAQHRGAVVFKLTAPQHAQAMAIEGAVLWDPSGKNHPMKEWVAIPATECKTYRAFAEAALDYASSNT